MKPRASEVTITFENPTRSTYIGMLLGALLARSRRPRTIFQSEKPGFRVSIRNPLPVYHSIPKYGWHFV